MSNATTTLTTDAERIAQSYIDLWNEADAARRAQLLQAHWTPDARYLDPMAQAQGHADISALIGAVQSRFPGFRFALQGQADAHGEQLRFRWTLGPQEATDLIEGSDFAELREGKLQRVTGFLDKVPVGA